MNGKREYDLRDQERREQAANVRVGALCRVEKFDPAAMRVDVQPLSKALDAGVYRTQPQILSVPVALVRGGGFVLRPCYKAGMLGCCSISTTILTALRHLEKKASRTRNATTLMKMPFLSVHLCRHLTRCLDCRTTAL